MNDLDPQAGCIYHRLLCLDLDISHEDRYPVGFPQKSNAKELCKRLS